MITSVQISSIDSMLTSSAEDEDPLPIVITQDEKVVSSSENDTIKETEEQDC